MTVKDQTLTETADPRLRGLVPLSVVIHSPSNPQLLAETISACGKNTGGCELEFVVVHGGSVLADVEQCRRTIAEMWNISWQALATREEHDPRNLGAQEARYDHVLFLGDGVRPASDHFFRVHASLHGSCSEKDFAVLGAIENDAPFNLGRFLDPGRQLASANPVPSTFLNPCYFSDSNISIKKSLVQDWLADGFSRDFPGSVGAVELAYRLSERCSRNLKILYEPSARATRHPVQALSEMFGPQVQLGRLLRLFIDRYPEAVWRFGLEGYRGDSGETALDSDYFTIIEGLKAWARIVDRRAGVRTGSWYSGFAQSILEVCLFQGYTEPGSGPAIPAVPGRLILERFMRELRLLMHDELAIHAGQSTWGTS